MGKQRAIKLNLNRTFEETTFKCDRNILKVDKSTVGFTPVCVFSEKKPRFRFWRGARNLVFFVDGALHALKFSKVTDEMEPFWTKKDEEKLIEREMKKNLTQQKPMTWSQFIILLIPVLVILGISLKIALDLRVF
jgi:hypothetical protein